MGFPVQKSHNDPQSKTNGAIKTPPGIFGMQETKCGVEVRRNGGGRPDLGAQAKKADGGGECSVRQSEGRGIQTRVSKEGSRW